MDEPAHKQKTPVVIWVVGRRKKPLVTKKKSRLVSYQAIRVNNDTTTTATYTTVF